MCDGGREREWASVKDISFITYTFKGKIDGKRFKERERVIEGESRGWVRMINYVKREGALLVNFMGRLKCIPHVHCTHQRQRPYNRDL